ncbi:PhnB protein [Clostridium botulinum]|uniref:PhnB protein n=1 Tax=Clostridium botulinum TaxID=1491 RepID=UPI001788C8FB|nr:PhnB protein [Clostridium botulinum]MBE1304089.1 PhnB protein [Clostridium botulinum]
MEEILKFYKGKLELKERRIIEYIEEKNSDEGFKSSKREIEYYVLKAEIELSKRFVDDLEYTK